MNYLNLSPGAAPLVVKVSEGDIGREISFTLVEDGLEYSIPTGSTITCEILKSDGHGTSIPCTWSGSVVTLETTEQSTIRAGKATAELRIVNGADDIGTANFILAVEPRPINADTDQTDSSYSQTGDAGDVWTLGSNGTPSWSPSGLDATTATAGQAPIADGAGGWAWGDVESGDSVPTEVRQAILALFQNAAYISNDMADEVAVVQSWATEVTSITLNRTSLSFGSVQAVILQATTVPSGASVIWSSSDTSVATVNGGVVTPVGNGQCTITASAGSKSATCAVSVSAFANLVSISAVYTQSDTVYTNDTLDSLKSDLVVTASYDNSTTQTVTDYVLSGTLAEGTSTITVAYSGKTTTFNVTVTIGGIYRYSDGDLILTANGPAWYAETGLYLDNNSNTGRTKRRGFAVGSGDRAFKIKNTDGTFSETEYYPISVPDNVTSVSVEITPNTQFVADQYYTLENGEYVRLEGAGAGWTQGSVSTTLAEHSGYYLAVNCKQDSAGSTYTTDPTELVITFS